ncbi:MAG: bifunctional proline dehydrogenase/L-glutamate gamma-semialdehyde dehydrogenase PutA [Pseudomonadota bacterium]
MPSLTDLRRTIRDARHRDEAAILSALTDHHAPSEAIRAAAGTTAMGLIEHLRTDASPGLMEIFLAEYGLSTDEGIALMCLAEALLRVPDTETIDALIEDKIAPSAWGKHLGHSSSPLVNASTWALMLTGNVLREPKSEHGISALLHGAIKRVGEPVIRAAVARAMKELGAQFVLGETISDAMDRARSSEENGYTYSYDMLGEAALTARDARAYFDAYSDSIAHLAAEARSGDPRDNPGISIKLSALHPRYEESQRERVMTELVERTALLARQAREANIGLNIDAEEADRLDLSLDVIEAVLADPALAGWDGFGVVVQAYGTRAAPVIDWLHALAEAHDRRIMVRLVKGAYWDTEIKQAQVDGLERFPVFTTKPATDVSWICCAEKLLGAADRIYPQFATHNAHSVATVIEMAHARGISATAYEFQRLHGMGEALHAEVMARFGTRCRIYAPVGAHRDLLAYLVRRLLENGANSSFVNQVLDEDVTTAEIAADPFAAPMTPNTAIARPFDLFQPERRNSRGWDLTDPDDLDSIDAAMEPYLAHRWRAGGDLGEAVEIRNPADPEDLVGIVVETSQKMATDAIADAAPWTANGGERAEILNRAADLYEAHFGEIFAVLTREAGKTRLDAIGELREAVDFLRYYAARIPGLTDPPRGRIACISPWNFPLAIFTGQIAAALAAGNAVLAKPAEQTPLTASIAVRLLHQAGVPQTALRLLPGQGHTVGATLTSDPRIDGVCFTGSTETAQIINRTMARTLAPTAPLIAETGGLNAMIVDSTALPEQAIRDILASSFQSAGQRCSALRVLYVQEDIAEPFVEMLTGAMDELRVGDPRDLATDVGPVIDAEAESQIRAHIEAARAERRILHELQATEAIAASPPDPQNHTGNAGDRGTFIAPTLIRVGGIADLDREIFGPVLHLATWKAEDLDATIDAINATGYGLTFGMHSRIDDRIAQATERVRCGNIYINRNQIGAIVGSQPFGGEGLSGTGPKAGGPDYVARFTRPERIAIAPRVIAPASPLDAASLADLRQRIDAARLSEQEISHSLPGPTGESNRLSTLARGVVLCLGPGRDAALEQLAAVQATGSHAIAVAEDLQRDEGLAGRLSPDDLATLEGVDAVIAWHDDDTLRTYRQALADRDGALIPLIAETDVSTRCRIERHVCIDTTASGGNASLLAGAA